MEVYQIGGDPPDCNIYLILDEKIALIDSGTGEHFQLVASRLSDLGLRARDVDMVINTHAHFDHAGGNFHFYREGCKIAAHEFEAGAIEEGDQGLTLAGLFGRRMEGVKVSLRLKEGDRLELGRNVLEVLHTPGHTWGSLSLLERKEGILFCGDLIFRDGIGRTDFPTGDPLELRKSIRRIFKLDLTKICPGHGPEFRKCSFQF